MDFSEFPERRGSRYGRNTNRNGGNDRTDLASNNVLSVSVYRSLHTPEMAQWLQKITYSELKKRRQESSYNNHQTTLNIR